MGRNRKLALIRRRIDRLDTRLLRLISRRATFAQQIGRIKHRRQWPVYDPAREAFVLRHVGRANRGPLSTQAVRRIFRAVLSECRRRQRKHRR